MANPFSGIITAGMKTLFKNMIDALLEDTALTVPCRFSYGDTKFSNCPNCKQGMNGLSSNVYNGTGPASFSEGSICPICVGKYKIVLDSNETIYMAVIWNHKNWLNLGLNITTPHNYCQSMSKMSTYPKIMQAKYILPDSAISNVVKSTYEREGNPQPLGFGEDAYILQMWKKRD